MAELNRLQQALAHLRSDIQRQQRHQRHIDWLSAEIDRTDEALRHTPNRHGRAGMASDSSSYNVQ